MAIIIGDGTGQGFEAAVNSRNELRVRSNTIQHLANESKENGTAFMITAGTFDFTAVTQSRGLFYLKNTGTQSIVLESVSVGGTGVAQLWSLVKNPTTGTLISSGTAATTTGMNFNRNTSLSAQVLKGTTSTTLTDGVTMAQWLVGASGYKVLDFRGGLVLGPGTSIGVSVVMQGVGTGSAFVNALAVQEDIF